MAKKSPSKPQDQMGLFGLEEPAEKKPAAPRTRKKTAAPKKPAAARNTSPKRPSRPRKGSGQVPEGDVRLTANIRADLHLKLKITAATRRTTIGDLIEELVEKHL